MQSALYSEGPLSRMYEGAAERRWEMHVRDLTEIDRSSFWVELSVYLRLLLFLILSSSVNLESRDTCGKSVDKTDEKCADVSRARGFPPFKS